MKKLFICILCFCFVGWNGVSAQTFTPSMTGSKNVQKNTPATKLKTTEKKSTSSTKNEAQQESSKTSTNLATVEKSFDTPKEKTKKYDNTDRKVFHFKMVDGDIVFDDDNNRSILIYYDNYQIHRGLDNMIRCSLRVYVLNDFKTKISNIGVKLKWPKISTAIQMNNLNPGVRTYKDIMLLGEGCFSIDKAPTIEVNRCRIKGISQEKCAEAIKWYNNK